MKKIRNISLFIVVAIIVVTGVSRISFAAKIEPIQVTIDGEQIQFDDPPANMDGRVLVPFRTIFESLEEDIMIIKIGNPYITVNGAKKEIDENKTSPIIIDGRTLIPIRVVVEEMGGSVGWDKTEKRVDIKLGDKEIKLWVDKKKALINNKEAMLDVPPIIINGRTMVPVRFPAENLGANVDWNNSKKEAIISYKKYVETEKDIETKPKTTIDSGNIQYSIPNQPVFFLEDRLQLLDGNEGQVSFRLKRPITLGEYSGFKVYFTVNGNPDIYKFVDDVFYYSEKIGKTVDISISTVNGTVESTPQNLKFTILDRIVGKEMWSERQTDDLLGSPCWYGLTWQPVEGATQYSVYVSRDVIRYMNFKNYRDLTGFSNIIVTDTSFSTKLNIGLPADIVNANWGESRYIVVFPMNEDGVIGPFPKHYQITMTGISSPAHY